MTNSFKKSFHAAKAQNELEKIQEEIEAKDRFDLDLAELKETKQNELL